MTMILKGLVVVPGAIAPSPSGEGAGMRRIANRPIICHVIDALVGAGAREVAIVVPPRSLAQTQRHIEEDRENSARVSYLRQSGRGHLAADLDAVAAFVGDDYAIAHRADGLLGQRLAPLDKLIPDGSDELVLMLHRSADERDRLHPATQRLLGVAELNGSPSRIALAGICLFGPGVLKRAAWMAQDPRVEQTIATVVEQLVSAGTTLGTTFVRSWRRYDGDPNDLLELNRIVLDQLTPDCDPSDRDENHFEGRVIIDTTAEVRASTVVGPSIIGANARITNSFIGPYTSIGPGAEIEGAEIVRSIVSEGARIMNVGGRIEASTIGRGASILRDFRLPRAMRLHVGQGVEVAFS
jgi:glucose-1-phosphate thymidylyltransferase